MYKEKVYKAYILTFNIYKMAEEFYEEEVYTDNAEDEEEESTLVEDDEITAEEEGFLRGYNEAHSVNRKAESEEEELD
jgi:hypothetical protein